MRHSFYVGPAAAISAPSLAAPSLASVPMVARTSEITALASPTDAAVELCEWASTHGMLGVTLFALVHMAAVVVCFPATILFEFAAGFTFGFQEGALVAWVAKVFAAMITFVASNGIGRSVLSRAGVEEAAARAFAAQPTLGRLAHNIEQDGARYVLLARLSPIPSWLNNYGLAFAGVTFEDYVPATALATVPAVLTHSYAGSCLSSLVSIMGTDTDAMPSTLLGSALSGLSVVGGGLLLQKLAASLAGASDGTVANVCEVDETGDRAARPGESRDVSRRTNVRMLENVGREPSQLQTTTTTATTTTGGGNGGDGNGDPTEEEMLLSMWRGVRDRFPAVLTGAGPSDGEADPAAALFNTFFIRGPFLLLLGALLTNILLGGGVTVGGVDWPTPAQPSVDASFL